VAGGFEVQMLAVNCQLHQAPVGYDDGQLEQPVLVRRIRRALKLHLQLCDAVVNGPGAYPGRGILLQLFELPAHATCERHVVPDRILKQSLFEALGLRGDG